MIKLCKLTNKKKYRDRFDIIFQTCLGNNKCRPQNDFFLFFCASTQNISKVVCSKEYSLCLLFVGRVIFSSKIYQDTKEETQNKRIRYILCFKAKRAMSMQPSSIRCSIVVSLQLLLWYMVQKHIQAHITSHIQFWTQDKLLQVKIEVKKI